MSNSIFHVRPLDSGKGWAIDEYDGRGAWQRSVLKTPEGAPMDKIQAQRAVFQLRRKAVNSVPKAGVVNKAACGATCPEGPSWTCRREFGHMGRHESPDGGDWHDHSGPTASECPLCRAHYGDTKGCDEGKPLASPHRLAVRP